MNKRIDKKKNKKNIQFHLIKQAHKKPTVIIQTKADVHDWLNKSDYEPQYKKDYFETKRFK